MALESFYKLKKKKQQKILDAINECLIKYDYDTLTIYNIVEEAEISRGSFYDYFYDKKDAVDTFVINYIKNMIVNFTRIIEKNDYKLFDGIIDTYNVVTKKLSDEIYYNVIKNIRYFTDFANGIIFSDKFEERYDIILDWMENNTYEGKNKILNRKEFRTVLDMTMSIITQTLFKYLMRSDKKNIEKNNIGKDFKEKIEVVKIGILNKKN